MDLSLADAVLLEKSGPVKEVLEDIFAKVKLPGAILEQLAGDPGGNGTLDGSLDGNGHLLDAGTEPDGEINPGVLSTEAAFAR